MLQKTQSKTLAESNDCRLPGKVYDLTDVEKAKLMNVSRSFLQKDRLRKNPRVDFARYGNCIRYSRT